MVASSLEKLFCWPCLLFSPGTSPGRGMDTVQRHAEFDVRWQEA